MSERLELLRGFVAESPDDPFPLYGLAMEHRRIGELAEAEGTFRRLRERFPDYLPQYLLHGQLLEMLDRPDDARALYQVGLELARRQGESYAEGELESALAALG